MKYKIKHCEHTKTGEPVCSTCLLISGSIGFSFGALLMFIISIL
jgi:hypothetical protein